MTYRGVLLVAVFLSIFTVVPSRAGEWIRPTDPNGPLIWGRSDGLVFGLPSPQGMRGPRGLIRVGVENQGGTAELVNFIAIEPVIAGFTSRFSRMGFSELDMSQLDAGQRGKRLWVYTPPGADAKQTIRGDLESLTRPPSLPDLLRVPIHAQSPPLERLSVRIEVEPYTNQAHVYVLLWMLSDQPNELRISVFTHPDSSPVEELTATATMGNYERLRQLWLKDRIVLSRDWKVGFDEFRDLDNFPVEEMLRYEDGDALALCTTNETDPSAIQVTASPPWTYRPQKLTQYWRVPAKDIQPDLRTKVNVRRSYWGSKTDLPGGTAFENFEVRERFVPGQTFIFGLNPASPAEFSPSIPNLYRANDVQEHADPK